MIRALFVFAALVACGRMSGPEGPLGAWPERVTTWDQCLEIWQCPNFLPFARVLDDPNHGSVFWYLSDQGHACVVAPGRDQVLHFVGEELVCRWRRAR